MTSGTDLTAFKWPLGQQQIEQAFMAPGQMLAQRCLTRIPPRGSNPHHTFVLFPFPLLLLFLRLILPSPSNYSGDLEASVPACPSPSLIPSLLPPSLSSKSPQMEGLWPLACSAALSPERPLRPNLETPPTPDPFHFILSAGEGPGMHSLSLGPRDQSLLLLGQLSIKFRQKHCESKGLVLNYLDYCPNSLLGFFWTLDFEHTFIF